MDLIISSNIHYIEFGVMHAVGISQAISNTTSSTSTGSAISGSGTSQFSASSGGDEVYPHGQILPHPNLRIFTFAELKAATRNFRSDTMLGEGGFGKVYKGWLDERGTSKSGSGTVIAVKKLNSESMQGYEEWQVNSLLPSLLLPKNHILLHASLY